MLGRNYSLKMEFNGHRRDGAVLTYISDEHTERWSIDMPAVLWLLDQIGAGDADPRSTKRVAPSDVLEQRVLRRVRLCRSTLFRGAPPTRGHGSAVEPTTQAA